MSSRILKTIRSTRSDRRRQPALLLVVVLLTLLAACGDSDESRSRVIAGRSAAESPSPAPTSSPTPTPSASPSPSPSPAPLAEGTYIALGDSLAVGVGATRPAETGYVGLLARSLASAESAPRATALVNLAVSGETSTSMIRTGQLAVAVDAVAAADPAVVLVTLDIGGNDLLRLLGTEVCASAPQSPDCLQLLALTIEDFEANYRQIIGELTAALDSHAPEARLAVLTYFNPFSGTDAGYESAAELALLGVDGRLDCDSADPQARGMNDVIACVAEEVGAIVADIQPRFTGLGLQLTHIASEDIHANDRGYAVIAEAFLEALRP